MTSYAIESQTIKSQETKQVSYVTDGVIFPAIYSGLLFTFAIFDDVQDQILIRSTGGSSPLCTRLGAVPVYKTGN